jgi:hypothetical protein
MVKEKSDLQIKIERFISSDPGEENRAYFCELALEVFRYQATNCEPYSRYISLLGVDISSISEIENIPFLPVKLFKSSVVYSSDSKPEKVFTSSATTGMTPSSHYVSDLSLYELSFRRGFELLYGSPERYNILALLPSYLEREGSSLIYMADHLIKWSKSPISGFYLYNHEELKEALIRSYASDRETLLLGVSFALVDFARNYNISIPDATIMETGGMKGRGEELSREEIHAIIKGSFGVKNVHSEYGMAELLSQAYSEGSGVFRTPHWMKFFLRSLSNPLRITDDIRGGLNIIDLSNINSCSFIETEDIGIKEAGNLWRIPGRIQNSEIRGCNLLLS